MDKELFVSAARRQLEDNIFKHSLSLSACMSALFDYFQTSQLLTPQDPPKEDWVIAGLIHDIDYSGEFKPFHPSRTKEVLAKYNLEISDSVHRIVLAHAPSLTGATPSNKAEWSIFCADSLTGLITAVAFVYPSKKLGDIKVSSVLKRFLKEPRFAAGTRRDEVAQCTNPAGLNLPLEKFVEICLTAMQSIASDLGL